MFSESTVITLCFYFVLKHVKINAPIIAFAAAPKSNDISQGTCNMFTKRVGIKKPMILPKSPLADQKPKIVPYFFGSKY
jgi:hypothetical protein